MRYLYPILLLLLPLVSAGQNLVPNGDLEDYIECPHSKLPPQLAYLSDHAAEWQVLSGSPDYFHECSPTISPVDNISGSEAPHSGSGYMAFSGYSPIHTIIMEIPKIQLTSQLQQDVDYYFQMFVSLADSSNYAVGEVGAHFSVDEPVVTEPFYQYFEPQIENDPVTNPLTSKTGWTKISGTYSAEGGEEWLAIGVFKYVTDLTIDTVSNDNWEANYYYVDDVQLIPLSDWLDVQEAHLHFSIYPNPATDNLRIESQTPLAQVKLTDLAGRPSIHQPLSAAGTQDDPITIDISHLPSGIYLLEAITQDGKRSVQKVVVQ